MKPKPDLTLDIRPLGAPWAMLKVAQAMRGLAPGGFLAVEASDPALERDLPQVVAAVGGRLCQLERTGDGMRFWFQSSGGPTGEAPPAGCSPQPKEE